MHRTTFFVLALFTLTLAAGAAATGAQVDIGRWTAPVAARTVLSLPGHGTVDGDTLHLPVSQRVELEVHATDQLGRAFPQQRFRFEFEFERDCNGLVELVDASDDGVTLQTGRGAGACDVLLWIPGNMNLDRRLQVVVGGSAQAAAVGNQPAVIDTREGRIAGSLFRALLAREPEADWLAAAAIQIRGGDTRTPLRAILGSPEFSQRRSTVGPEELLRGIYQGLLGREPDAGAYRTYLERIRRGNIEEVVGVVLRSSEFQQRHAAAVG